MSRTCSPLPLLIIMVILSRCISPFEVELEDSGDLLVVEGAITDQPGPYTVRLSSSRPLAEEAPRPVGGAQVSLESSEGLTLSLAEHDPGVYQTDSGTFRGQTGRQYRLRILTREQTYLSSWETLKAGAEIDSLYPRVDFVPTVTGEQGGIRFFINLRDAAQTASYYRWEWEETWRYFAPLASDFIYLGNDNIDLVPAKRTCYRTVSSSEINIANASINQGVLLEHPVAFVSGADDRLVSRYSLLVRQIPMDEAEYLFWKGLYESNTQAGSLYDRQPVSVKGNVFNEDDPDAPVLGYFSAYSPAEKRIFVGRTFVPDSISVGSGIVRDCYSSIDTIPRGPGADQQVFEAIAEGKVFYDFDRFVQITGYLLTTPECSDCTLQGGTLTPPDFWTD